jgi:hypothetical protein
MMCKPELEFEDRYTAIRSIDSMNQNCWLVALIRRISKSLLLVEVKQGEDFCKGHLLILQMEPCILLMQYSTRVYFLPWPTATVPTTAKDLGSRM